MSDSIFGDRQLIWAVPAVRGGDHDKPLALTVGILAVVLAAGTYSWVRPSNDSSTETPGGVTVVQSAPNGAGSKETNGSNGVSQTAPAAGVNSVSARGDSRNVLEDTVDKPPQDIGSDPNELYKRIRGESRGNVWADRSEDTIKNALAGIPFINHGDALRVNCAATLCEVRGAVPEGASDDNANVAMGALQGNQFEAPLNGAGLQSLATVFGGTAKSRTFTIYAKRQ